MCSISDKLEFGVYEIGQVLQASASRLPRALDAAALEATATEIYLRWGHTGALEFICNCAARAGALDVDDPRFVSEIVDRLEAEGILQPTLE